MNRIEKVCKCSHANSCLMLERRKGFSLLSSLHFMIWPCSQPTACAFKVDAVRGVDDRTHSAAAVSIVGGLFEVLAANWRSVTFEPAW